MIKILHTADVHLDSPFARLDPRRSELRRRELRATFSKMMSYASESGVDLVLIAGDLFDNGFVTRETVAILIHEFSKLSCPVVISPGNHDCVSDKSVWARDVFPENVHVFKTGELQKFSFDAIGCDVYGYAFTAPNMRRSPLEGKKLLKKDADRLSILCAHGDTMSPISPYCPLPNAVLEAFGADYTALGHIHNPEEANTSISVAGGYPGCPEGRDFGEVGPKGAILAEIEKTDGKIVVRTQRQRFSRRIYETVELSVDGAATLSEIETKLRTLAEINPWNEETLLSVTIRGSVEPSLVINTAALADSLSAGLFYVEVRDATVPTWNAESLLGDRGIRGEVYRTLLPKLNDSDPVEREIAARALRYGLAALGGENVIDY